MNAVDEARRWIGYLEHKDGNLLGVYTANIGKGGYTIFSDTVKLPQGLPWCVTFLHAVYSRAVGEETTRRIMGKPHPGTRKLERTMRRKGFWRNADFAPLPGDIIFLSPRDDGRIGHCGIVEYVDADTVTSIDGNTVDPTGHFPEEQGGAVARRTRKRDDSRILGYGIFRTP